MGRFLVRRWRSTPILAGSFIFARREYSVVGPSLTTDGLELTKKDRAVIGAHDIRKEQAMIRNLDYGDALLNPHLLTDPFHARGDPSDASLSGAETIGRPLGLAAFWLA
jgi:hypothetical protein